MLTRESEGDDDSVSWGVKRLTQTTSTVSTSHAPDRTSNDTLTATIHEHDTGVNCMNTVNGLAMVVDTNTDSNNKAEQIYTDVTNSGTKLEGSSLANTSVWAAAPANVHTPAATRWPLLSLSAPHMQKLVFTLSVCSVILIAVSLASHQSLLIYYYVILTPILMCTRFVQYWKLKWQLFLADFCYFGNLMMFVYLWLLPAEREVFSVMFALSNGPMLWAVVLFRNSLVFHDIDKMTSTYIHLLPAYVSFCIRWYPANSAIYWYTTFTNLPLTALPDFFWLFLVPFLFYLIHLSIYVTIVHVIIKPHSTYLDSFRYLTSKESSLFYKLLNICGERYQLLLYHVWSVLFAITSLLLSQLCYTYISAHCIYLSLLTLICIINGAYYYIDVYGVNGNNRRAATVNSTTQPVAVTAVAAMVAVGSRVSPVPQNVSSNQEAAAALPKVT